jgi:hypothetical protein
MRRYTSGNGTVMIHLELGEREAHSLKTALTNHLVGMRTELVHTDDREYRADLKAELERLEVVLQRLEQIMVETASSTPVRP